MTANHMVAIVGGAVSGSEAAFELSRKGIACVVFDQNALPYGKIEDGLPMWHVKLRDHEEAKIDERLTHPLVHYVPFAKLGKDLDFSSLVNEWDFSAVLLASGAWRDRPLPVPNADAFVGKGLVYQNPFVQWFNHHHDPKYPGQKFQALDNAVVVGGGLASIDVVKLLMLMAVSEKLQAKGIKTDLLTLEHESPSKVLAANGLTLEALGLKGCLLVYRRGAADMPLSTIPADATPEKRESALRAREKILQIAQTKFGFRFMGNTTPSAVVSEGGRLTGLKLVKTELRDGRPANVPGSEFEIKTPLVVSSIGSIPEPLTGVPMNGELFKIRDLKTGQFEGSDHVFGLGNAVTGKGNIKASFEHGKQVVEWLMSAFLSQRPALDPSKTDALLSRVKALQNKAGYAGDFAKWKSAHAPVRYEHLHPASH